MLRTVADGRVRWGFWPPGEVEARRGVGVWLGGNPDLEALGAESESESEEEEEGDGAGEASSERDQEVEEEEVVESEDEGDFARQNQRSFFAALSLEDQSETDSDDS